MAAVDFNNEQSSSTTARTSARHMSIGHHSFLLHDPLSNLSDSVSIDDDQNRMSVVNCLIPSSVAIAAR